MLNLRWSGVATIAMAVVLAMSSVYAAHWEGPLLKPLPREDVFSFTRKPVFRAEGKDRYEITFAAKGHCDVAVAIHDGSGKVVRHLVAGVLGPNVPEGLQKNSLEQKVVWNGKDDRGEYVPDPKRCKARVSLGLSPTFNKIIGWHPHDITGQVGGIGADKDGVYVWDMCNRAQIKKFTHEGEYVRTIFPWPSDTFQKDVKGAGRGPKPAGEHGPSLGMFGTILGMGDKDNRRPVRPRLPVRNGLILVSTKGWRALKRTYLLGTDGTSRGRSIAGPVLARKPSQVYGFYEHEVSPDGRWLYSILGPTNTAGFGGVVGRVRNAVYKLALTEKGPIGKPCIGEENISKYAAKGDDRHLNMPMGLFCDEQGRLYVSDHGNNRIQVFDCSGKFEAKLLKTIPCRNPNQLAIHHKTGEIYVHCFKNLGKRSGSKTEVKVVKFGPFENPKKLKEWKVPVGPSRGFCLDSWANPPRLWFAQWRNAVAFKVTENGLERFCSFAERVRKDGYTFGALSAGYRENIQAFKGGNLYYGFGKSTHPYRIDPEKGKKMVPIGFPKGWALMPDEMVTGEDGYFYIRAFAAVGRFREPTTPYRGTLQFAAEDEVLFDYGEKIEGRFGQRLRGVVRAPSQSGGNGLCHGFDVAHNGDIMVLCENAGNKDLKNMLADMGKYRPGGSGSGWIKAVQRDMANGPLYRPQLTPGVMNGGQLVFVWDRRGELKGENLIPAPPMKTVGIRGDKWGNIYIGVGWKPCRPDGGKYPFWGARVGTLMKFPPTGGRLYGKIGPILLSKNDLPKRPRELAPQGKGAMWSRNALWSFPGISQVHTDRVCACPQCRFDLDLFGRVFAPRAWRFSAAILDTNGNRIIEVGRYGNADSGRGADSHVKVPGGISLAHCSFVCTVSDRWLYLNDSGNNRVIRAKLGYAVEERVGLRTR